MIRPPNRQPQRRPRRAPDTDRELPDKRRSKRTPPVGDTRPDSDRPRPSKRPKTDDIWQETPDKRRSKRTPPPIQRPERKPKPAPPPKPEPPEPAEGTFIADVAEGLERIALSEMRRRFEERIERLDEGERPGEIRFTYVGNPYQLLKLQTVQAVYRVQHFAVPRPKALLGHQHFTALLKQIAAVRDLSPEGAYTSLHINAAGSETSVMKRLRDELAAAARLQPADDEGDLLIRLRHPPGDDESWEALIRLSPRPLATRAWRVCNREGALNATIANAMAFLTQPKPDDVYLNLLCGTGTLLIERLALESAKSAIGYDEDESALDCARRNVEAAGLSDKIQLRRGDARDLPLAAKSVDTICADLPFGHLVGSHEGNLELYPAVLREAARVLKPAGRCVIISHEVRLMESLLEDSPHWTTGQIIRVEQGGLNPRIFVLVRK